MVALKTLKGVNGKCTASTTKLTESIQDCFYLCGSSVNKKQPRRFNDNTPISTTQIALLRRLVYDIFFIFLQLESATPMEVMIENLTLTPNNQAIVLKFNQGRKFFLLGRHV